MIDEVTKDVTEGIVKEFLDADGLALRRKLKEVEERYYKWKAMEGSVR